MAETVGATIRTDDRYEALRHALILADQMVKDFELAAAKAHLALTESMCAPHNMGEPSEGMEWRAKYEICQEITKGPAGLATPTIVIRTTWFEQEPEHD